MMAWSLRQPWAQLLATGKKTVETRTQYKSFRDEFLIHASKTFNHEDLVKFGYNQADLSFGAIIGKGNLTAVWQYRTKEEFENDVHLHLVDEFYGPKVFGFLVKDAVKFETPIPCRGMLNFFRVGPEVERLLPK